MKICLIKVTSLFSLLFVFIMSSCNLSSNGTSGGMGSPNYSVINKENISRDVWQKPSIVLGYLGNIEDKTIADIGAGTGYFTFRMALNAKKVIAIEIDPDMIDLINAFKINLPKELEGKIETRLATAKESNLKKEEADIIVMINTISYIDDKFSYIKKLIERLPEGGKIMFVDYKRSIAPASLEHGPYDISYESLQTLLKATGFSQVDIHEDDLEYQYIVIATK